MSICILFLVCHILPPAHPSSLLVSISHTAIPLPRSAGGRLAEGQGVKEYGWVVQNFKQLSETSRRIRNTTMYFDTNSETVLNLVEWGSGGLLGRVHRGWRGGGASG
eukprot:750519-Hanusia_phi.AAC.1